KGALLERQRNASDCYCPGPARPTGLALAAADSPEIDRGTRDADSSGAHEQERIRHQIIGSLQFLLQELVLLERKRSGKITRLHWEIFAADEVGLPEALTIEEDVGPVQLSPLLVAHTIWRSTCR